ncbi:MAG: hypothetical protein HRF50_14185 [Phycisphaerae bacterium]|jgi:hypothetical protein
MSTPPNTDLLPLPIPGGEFLRLAGPTPESAAVAVEIATPIDEPMTVVGFFLGAFCGSDGEIILPLEIVLAADASATTATRQVPAAAVLAALRSAAEVNARLPVPAGLEWIIGLTRAAPSTGLLLYCRKRHVVFPARSPRTGGVLASLTAAQSAELAGELGGTLISELISWDGPANAGAAAQLYGGSGATCSLGKIESLEQLVLDQGGVAHHGETLRASDPAAAAALALAHACVACSERPRCYPEGGGYAYAVDRLTPLSVNAAPPLIRPYGEWRLQEAARIVGGVPPSEIAAASCGVPRLDEHRRRRAEEIERAGPVRLLAGETDGRELLEVARVKLALLADALAQLDAAWRAAGHPHLAWNADTLRVTWRAPIAVPATSWGFQVLLRKVGLHPATTAEVQGEGVLCYPPGFSTAALLPPDAVEAARYFDIPRPATVFVKQSRVDRDRLQVKLLLEELGIPWRLFSTLDVMHVEGRGWTAELAPERERNPDDGEGLPFSGVVTGAKDAFRDGSQIEGCSCRWLPRFGQAVDLHAVGALGLEALLATDERSGAAWFEALAKDCDELSRACAALPPEQRDERARAWIGDQCEVDSPSALWTRRNLLYRRADRNAARLDGFPPPLWHAILTWALRCVTAIPGFSFCADRSRPAPRIEGDLLLPLVELRGLLALLDDLLLGRTAPQAAVRDILK